MCSPYLELAPASCSAVTKTEEQGNALTHSFTSAPEGEAAPLHRLSVWQITYVHTEVSSDEQVGSLAH